MARSKSSARSIRHPRSSTVTVASLPTPGAASDSARPITTQQVRPPSPRHAGPGPQSQQSPAEALASITLELNMRTLDVQATRLEKDLKTLVEQTKEDRGFREHNESRMREIFKELMAVKVRSERIEGSEAEVKARYDSCHKETLASVSQFRKDMSAIQRVIKDLSMQLDALPTIADLDDVAKRLAALREPSLPPLHGRRRSDTSQSKRTPTLSIHERIQEFVNSTKRWHHEHKSTKLDEHRFLEAYFTKQSRRDPVLALHLQKTMRRVVFSRVGGRPRPKNLEEFCRELSWDDVKRGVEKILVLDREATVAAFG